VKDDVSPIVINRLDPNVPDPVESRRRAAGRLVRLAYGLTVFGVLAFFIVYFGAPFVYLGGPGTVTSPRHVVSLPYIVQVNSMNVVPGVNVTAGEQIGEVSSPEVAGVIATYMRALADIYARGAELRIKLRVAQKTIEASRDLLKLTEQTIERIEATSAASMTFRVEIYRERAQAQRTVITQETEITEIGTQLFTLDEFTWQIRERMDEIERHFQGGRIRAPVAGVISTNVAHVGQSLVAGTPIAEILDPTDVFVDWYIPNERLADPKVGNAVFVLFGNRRIPGKIVDILPVSDVYAGRQLQLGRDRQATQIARIRFDADAMPPALNSTVYIHMYYTGVTARIAGWLVWLLGLDRA
jgi:hypothetical protein